MKKLTLAFLLLSLQACERPADTGRITIKSQAGELVQVGAGRVVWQSYGAAEVRFDNGTVFYVPPGTHVVRKE